MPAHDSTPLRLNACPQCGYDLRGHARDGACPECGARYDESMFFLPLAQAWSPLTVCLVFAFLAVMAGSASALLFARNRFGAGTWLALIALMLIGLFIGSIVALARSRRSRESEMLATADGLRWKRGLGQHLLLPWKHFRIARVRRVRPLLWVLTLRDKFWNLNPSNATVSVYVAGSTRDMAKLRNELRRRIRRARQERHPRDARPGESID